MLELTASACVCVCASASTVSVDSLTCENRKQKSCREINISVSSDRSGALSWALIDLEFSFHEVRRQQCATVSGQPLAHEKTMIYLLCNVNMRIRARAGTRRFGCKWNRINSVSVKSDSMPSPASTWVWTTVSAIGDRRTKKSQRTDSSWCAKFYIFCCLFRIWLHRVSSFERNTTQCIYLYAVDVCCNTNKCDINAFLINVI